MINGRITGKGDLAHLSALKETRIPNSLGYIDVPAC